MVEDAANLQRLQKTARLVPEAAKSLIDVGCGNGVFARMLKQRPDLQVTCVDRSPTALDHVVADEKRCCEIVSLPFEDRAFDCVTCLEVVEHLSAPDYSQALAELARIARSTIFIGVPYNEAIDKNVDTCPQCRTVFNRDLHLRAFDDAVFSSMLESHGFHLQTRSIPVTDTHYLGFRTYFKLRRALRGEASAAKAFLSPLCPLCPLCGYAPPPRAAAPEAPAKPAAPQDAGTPTPAKTGGLKGRIKRLWPKVERPGYWIVGRFQRNDA